MARFYRAAALPTMRQSGYPRYFTGSGSPILINRAPWLTC
jgi:hypothetical protein